MTIIQLNPALQQSVRLAKLAELSKQTYSFMVSQSLSTNEKDALVKTFTTPSETRTKDANVRSYYWW
ncbi:hypothetical protein ASG89_26380 [Paenibacillus sp. Soil766]|uniref:hypothetical protein n=1 Tax=Paenibacillus sp. Soil766 TaxID=1736404 RepID=UPI00070EFFA7|nr:hypothetical protein [Paenibacillus sp. Soil766]KRF01132.1 hypothetical protein ASG89_26380 [Paenibacillus sp. Soil766]